MSKHTPGPWIECAESGDWWIQRDNPEDPTDEPMIVPDTSQMSEGNIRLICAAPDLLEACQAYIAAHETKSAAEYVRAMSAATEQIRAAVDKAQSK